MRAPTRLILVRHAQAEGMNGRCCGRLDPEISPSGREFAEHLADSLAGEQLAALYTSPLRRAHQTAEPIARRHRLNPEPLEDLRELDFGELEGMTYTQIARTRPELYHSWMTTPTQVQFPRGESYADLKARVDPTLSMVRERHSSEAVAVITHGGVIHAGLASALLLPDDAVFRIHIPHGCLSTIDWYGDRPLLSRHGQPAAHARATS